MKNVLQPKYLLLSFAILLFASCSTEKNTTISRFYQGMTTRFNVFYNGEMNYNKATKNQLQNYAENFTQTLPIHPVSKLKGQTVNEYDRTIEKCQKAIKLHSIKTKPTFTGTKGSPKYKEWQQIEEYNPYLHNAWLMMARAQFYKGDFMAASSTFSYIARHFRNIPQAVNESQIWTARCLAELNWLYEAEDILRKMKTTELNTNNKYLWNLANADLLLKQRQETKAIPYLETAIAGEPNKTQRYRFNYILGQVYAENGDLQKAYAAFDNVIKLSPPYEVEFSARIKQTECMGNEKSGVVLKKLVSLTKKSKNKNYLDQLYYAIGNIYATKRDTSNAVKNYLLSIKNGEKNADQKSLSQIKLGDIYFKIRKYKEAQPCYSEAIATIGKEHPEYDRLSKRSDALDELITQYQNVHLQDSLLRITALSPAEKTKVIEKIISDLIKKEKEDKKAEELEKLKLLQEERGETFNNQRNQTPSQPNLNGDKSWYFYNTASVTKGKSDFQSRWGSRKLEDNWRRKNKNAFSFSDNTTQQTTTEQKTEIQKKDTSAVVEQVSDPKNPLFYLQQLPKTEEDFQNANEIINDGMYNMALVYKNKLEDYPLSISTFDELLTRYPNSPNKADVYYNIYLIGQQWNNNQLSEKYKAKLIAEFPKNKYAIALADPNFIQNYLNQKNEVETLYEKTYASYLKNDGQSVRATYTLAKEKYPLSKLLPKFAFLNALSYLSEKNTDEFKKALKEILEKYTDAEITALAGSMMTNITQGKQISGESVNNNIWNTKIGTTASTKDKEVVQKAEFTIDPISPHYILFVYPADSTYNNRLMYEVAGFNFSNFAIRDFDFDMLPLQGIGMLRVKGFASLDEVKIYRSRLFGEKGIANRLPSQLKTVLISEKNFESLLKGRTFEEYFTFFEKTFDLKQNK